MNFRKQTVSLQQAKETDLVEYLYELGHLPSKISASNYWYHSPLRTENTPSFKVNRKINRWYDFGLGEGGNLIDFAIRYHHCTIAELLENFGQRFSLHQPTFARAEKIADGPSNIVSVSHVSPVHSKPLIQYLFQRKISMETAHRFCQQVNYQVAGKSYFALGFKNNAGGYELRNQFVKISSSPKDFTSINNGKDSVCVFEGFFDLMSFAQIAGMNAFHSQNYVVLNSISLFERARPFLESHKQIRLYMDNDTTGQTLTSHAMSLDARYQDSSSFYQSCKDLNEWLVSNQQMHENSTKQRLGIIPN